MASIVEPKNFAASGGGCNADSVDTAVLPNQWVNSENVRTGSTDKGVTDVVESIGSTALLSTPLPSVTFVTIGSVEDEANNRILYFKCCVTGPWHKITCYDFNTNTEYDVLYSAQVTGGLTFNKNKLIHSARVASGLLYFTDNLNAPRRINIDAGIKLNNPSYVTDVEPYTSPLNPQVITVIRKPPNYTLTPTKKVASDVGITINTNNIKNNAFRFSYLYTYRDGEISALAAHSVLVPFNFQSDTYDIIEVVVPLFEKIDQDVQKVSLYVIYADDNTNSYEIKTWDKANATDLAAINDHNSNISPLTFYFSNDSIGAGVGTAKYVKPYDSVPRLSETLEIAKNRLFLGNNLVGYNTPLITSLTATVITADSGTTQIDGELWHYNIDYDGDPLNPTDIYTEGLELIYFPIAIDGTHPAGFYDSAINPFHIGAGSVTVPLNMADYQYIGVDDIAVQNYVVVSGPAGIPLPVWANVTSVYYTYTNPDVIYTNGSLQTSNVSALKTGSARRLAIQFYDLYMRNVGGIVESNSGLVTIPKRDYDFTGTINYGIQWNLSILNAFAEIPEEAYFYSILATNDLVRLSFEQARTSPSDGIRYATKDADGIYTFTETTYDTSRAGVAVRLDLLNSYGMGYSFDATNNDVIEIWVDGVGSQLLSVIGVSSNWVIAELYDFGNLAAANALFEIYTPLPVSAAQNFYEQGQIYSILNPGTGNRNYSTLTGQLVGDIYLLERGTTPDTYITENMSPSKTRWSVWLTNSGRPQFKTSIGERRLLTSVRWSNTYIEETVSNGLSSFDALDQYILPQECGALYKLITTSKVNNEQGVIMLSICRNQTASMYLGEVQLLSQQGNAYVAQSDNVIGTVNVLQGNFGTSHPESVVAYRNLIFYWDNINGRIIQYSNNGLFPISNYNFTRFWKLFTDQFNSMSTADIEALGSRPFVFGGVDPRHDEVLFTIPKLLSTPPKGYLIDYPSTIYPFDIYDGQAKTICFNLKEEPNYWQGAYSFTPEYMIYANNQLYSFKYGHLWEHNQTNSYNNFYGTQYSSKIMFISNMGAGSIKTYEGINVQANLTPNLAYFLNENPYLQVTDIMDYEWGDFEGFIYAYIKRNKIVPNASGYTLDGLLTAEMIRAYALKIMLQYDVTTTPLNLRLVNVKFNQSRGH